jgi:hypothetical protein
MDFRLTMTVHSLAILQPEKPRRVACLGTDVSAVCRRVSQEQS